MLENHFKVQFVILFFFLLKYYCFLFIIILILLRDLRLRIPIVNTIKNENFLFFVFEQVNVLTKNFVQEGKKRNFFFVFY